MDLTSNHGNTDSLERISVSWTSIPLDLWDVIFSYLNLQDQIVIVRAVCRDWNRLFWDTPVQSTISPRNHLNFSCFKTRVPNNVLFHILCKRPHLKSLSFQKYGVSYLSNPVLVAIAPYCNKDLESLSLEGCQKIDTVTLNSFLTYLNLRGCIKITRFSTLPKEFWRTVQVLDFTHLYSVDSTNLQFILQNSSSLQELHLLACSRLNNLTLFPHNSTLQALVLSYCPINGDSLRSIAQHCPELQSISLQNCKDITPENIMELVTHCTKLARLNLIEACNRDIHDECVEAISNLPYLEELNLKNCGEITSNGLIELCKASRLKTLNLDRLLKIDDEGMRILCERIGTSLRTLNLGSSTALTDQTLLSISRHCSNLIHLNLARWSLHTNSLLAVCQGCERLEVLNLAFCENLSMEFVELILQTSKQLRKLNLSETAIAPHKAALKQLEARYPHIKLVVVKYTKD